MSNLRSNLRVVDLHPEELLERDALGELDDTERERLQAHLGRCATCRFERQLRADFSDDLEGGDAAPVPFTLAADVLARASGPSPMAERSGTGTTGAIELHEPDEPEQNAQAPVLPPAIAPLQSRSMRRRAVRAVWLLSAAALLLLAGGAAAAIGLGGRAWPALLGHAPRIASPALMAPAAPAPKAHAVAMLPLAPAVDAVDAPAPQAAVEARAPVAAVATHHAVPEAGPQELFDAETAARRLGDYPRVLALHRELGQRFPRSREAQVSRATVGHLLLDRGNPVEALANFDAYLAAGSGNLGEEAMVGRATALDRLGRTAEASLAWRALVAAFPDSPFAAHARARVESLIGN